MDPVAVTGEELVNETSLGLEVVGRNTDPSPTLSRMTQFSDVLAAGRRYPQRGCLR